MRPLASPFVFSARLLGGKRRFSLSGDRHVARLAHDSRLQQQRDQSAPAGLVRGADATAIVTVKVFMKQHEIT